MAMQFILVRDLHWNVFTYVDQIDPAWVLWMNQKYQQVPGAYTTVKENLKKSDFLISDKYFFIYKPIILYNSNKI